MPLLASFFCFAILCVMEETACTWAILGALDREIALLRERMKIDRIEQAMGTEFAFGTLMGRSVAVAC